MDLVCRTVIEHLLVLSNQLILGRNSDLYLPHVVPLRALIGTAKWINECTIDLLSEVGRVEVGLAVGDDVSLWRQRLGVSL